MMVQKYFHCSIFRTQLPVYLPSFLHAKAVVKHGAGEGQVCRHHLPLPPGAAQAAARLPPVHQGGGSHPRRARLPRQGIIGFLQLSLSNLSSTLVT